MAEDKKYSTFPARSSKKTIDKDNDVTKEEGCIPSGSIEFETNRDLLPSPVEGLVEDTDKSNLTSDVPDNKRKIQSWDCRRNDFKDRYVKSNPLRWTTGSRNIRDTSLTHDLFLLYVPNKLCNEIQTLTNELQSCKEVLKYLDFETDFLPTESLFNIVGSCLMQSRRAVLVLSPLFYSSNLYMYFLEMIVAYCVDHDRNGIISLLVGTTESERPKSLNPFACFDSKNDHWLRDFIQEAKKEVKPIVSNICLNENHFSLDNFSTIRSVYSEPATLKFHNIPESIKERLKIWSRFHEKKKKHPEKHSISQAKEAVERSVDSVMAFAIKLRHEKKKVYECTRTFIKNSLQLAAGDVVEIISVNDSDPKKAEVRDYNGHTGEIPIDFLTPSVFVIPSAAVKLLDQPISKENNDEYKQALEDLGQSVFMATETSSGNSLKLQAKKADILSMISDNGNRCLMKNYHNEVGYINKSFVTKLEPGNVSRVCQKVESNA